MRATFFSAYNKNSDLLELNWLVPDRCGSNFANLFSIFHFSSWYLERFFLIDIISDECYRTPLMIRLQAITWASADPDLYRHMASLGHNELNANIVQIWTELVHRCDWICPSIKKSDQYIFFDVPVAINARLPIHWPGKIIQNGWWDCRKLRDK